MLRVLPNESPMTAAFSSGLAHYRTMITLASYRISPILCSCVTIDTFMRFSPSYRVSFILCSCVTIDTFMRFSPSYRVSPILCSCVTIDTFLRFSPSYRVSFILCSCVTIDTFNGVFSKLQCQLYTLELCNN